LAVLTKIHITHMPSRAEQAICIRMSTTFQGITSKSCKLSYDTLTQQPMKKTAAFWNVHHVFIYTCSFHVVFFQIINKVRLKTFTFM